MEDFTAQDELNLEHYQSLSTEALFDNFEVLDYLKQTELKDPLINAALYGVQDLKQIDNTIDLIRKILDERNAIQ